jgi:hypothetical protein
VLVDRFTSSYLRLLKTFAIAEALDLSSTEVNYFGTYSDYQLNGEGWLNALPTSLLADNAAILPELLKRFTALLNYGELKESLKVKDDLLIKIFVNPNAITEDKKSLLERVTSWDNTSLNALYTHFGLTSDDLKHLEAFIRINEAFNLVKKIGIKASTLVTNTTNEPTAAIIRNLQSALRARYDESAWFQVIQPINDKLRNLQRDALVTFILHQFQQQPETQHINTPDKLFEYFLIDVEMDACMKTSRIKQAISTVQLFIQRCLLNLEKDANDENKGVAPSSIKAKQWEWMKRYRVWEANRKVFLFPENWLEPELRDNKSPFFKDLESELLQSDITEDSAAIVLVHYLEKLDEVAKLEICGMYYEENEMDNVADDIIHVIGRTAGARRKYYYRRLEGGSWTPWEKVDVEIEDNPVLPVVWKGRLFLFWVSVIQKAPDNQQTPQQKTPEELAKEPSVAETKPSQLRSFTSTPSIEVSVNLYWSEYYNNKWQPPKTSDINKPLFIGQFNPGEFDRTKLELSSLLTSKQECKIHIEYPGLTPIDYVDAFIFSYFKLYNTHSLPIPIINLEPIQRLYPFLNSKQDFDIDLGKLSVSYNYQERSQIYADVIVKKSISKEVLSHTQGSEIVKSRHFINDIFEAPFFCQDSRHVFFVRSEKSIVLIPDYSGIEVLSKLPIADLPITDIPPIIYESKPFPTNPSDPRVINSRVANPSLVESFIDNNISINKAISRAGTISFGDKLIGINGSLNIENQGF